MPVEHRRSVVALALIASFMVFVDGTIVNVTVAQLAAHLNATRAELEWSLNAYTLSFAALMLGAGAIADTIGAKRAFITGLVVFTGASAVCAAATSMLMLNLARLVQGAGSALLLPSALVLATASATDEHARQRLVGWWAAAGGAGMAAGPLLGGGLVALANWRAVFAVNVVLGIPALIWSLVSMPAVVRRVRRLDLAGVATATVFIGGLVFALIEAPGRGWLDPAIITAAGLAIAGAAAFIGIERTIRQPLLPLQLYADRGFTAAAAQGTLLNFAFYGVLFTMSLLLQQGRGLSALTTGLLFLPLTGLISIANLLSAPITRRIGRPRLLVVAQSVLMLALLGLAWASTAAAVWPMILALVPIGISSGLLVPTMTAQSIAAVEPGLHGAASAAFNTSRQIGGAIGVATFGPLLGTAQNLTRGFITCALVAAGASFLGLLVAAARLKAVPDATFPPPSVVYGEESLGPSGGSECRRSSEGGWARPSH
ncbi:MFS transporter [Kribbella sp. NPDC026611]|uniref:MFS transporter n=1 Tax=Kribbella sp. NPDC026611 TaxID=3154911 RepID=UPI0033D838D9